MVRGIPARDIASEYMIGLTTVFKIIYEVCDAIVSEFREYIAIPSTIEEWKNIATDIEKERGMPHSLGCIDGKHISIICPKNSGSLCRNYKHNFSLVLLAVAKVDYSFIYVQVGNMGRESDGGIFKNSKLHAYLSTNAANVPPPEPIPGFNVPVNYFLLGDRAFAKSNLILPPKYGTFLDEKWLKFNKIHSGSRMIIEQAFGILTQRFSILKRPIHASMEHVDKIVMAICTIHNVIIKMFPAMDNEDIQTRTNLESVTSNDVQSVEANVDTTMSFLKDYIFNYK